MLQCKTSKQWDHEKYRILVLILVSLTRLNRCKINEILRPLIEFKF